MIKEIFVLKKNSWHTKLMKKIWNVDYYQFPNMCPYFWLSVLNVIIAPFFFIGLGIAKLFKFIVSPITYIFSIAIDKLEEYNNRCEIEHFNWITAESNRIRERLRANEIHPSLEAWWRYFHLGKSMNKKEKSLWYSLDYEEQDQVKELFIQRHEIEEEEALALEIADVEVKATQLLNTNVARYSKYTKWIGKAIVIAFVIAVVGFLGYWVALGLWYGAIALYNVAWIPVINWLAFYIMCGAIIVAGVLTMYLIGDTIRKLIIWLACRYGSYCIPCIKRKTAIGNFFRKLFRPIKLGIIWFVEGCVTVWDILTTLKADNCPGIDWE